MNTISSMGAKKILARFFNNTYDTGTSNDNHLRIHLFTNNYTPLKTDDKANYTEAEGGGYESKKILSGDWSIDIVDGVATAVYSVEFVFTAPLDNGTIYGYYVCDRGTGTSGGLLYAEKMATSFTPAQTGDSLTINLKVTLDIP